MADTNVNSEEANKSAGESGDNNGDVQNITEIKLDNNDTSAVPTTDVKQDNDEVTNSQVQEHEQPNETGDSQTTGDDNKGDVVKSDIDIVNDVTEESQAESSNAQVSAGSSSEQDDLDKPETNPEATVAPTETVAETVANTIATEVLEEATADLGQMSDNAADTATESAAVETDVTDAGVTEAVVTDANPVEVEGVGSDEVVADDEGDVSEVQAIDEHVVEISDSLPTEGTESGTSGTTAGEGEAVDEANVAEEATASDVTGDNAELTAAIEVADGTEAASTSDDVPTHIIALEEETVDETAQVDNPSMIANDDAIVTIVPPTDDDDNDQPVPFDDVVNSDGSTPIPPSLTVPFDGDVNSDGVTPISSPRMAKASDASIASNGTLEHELAQFSRDLEEPSISSGDIDAGVPTPVNKSSTSNYAANQEALLVEAEELRRQVAELKARETSAQKNLTSTDSNLSAAERKVKDLQLRIIRSAKEDQEKDRAIALLEKSVRDLQGELEVVRDKGDVEQHQTSAPAQQVPAKSKSCVLL